MRSLTNKPGVNCSVVVVREGIEYAASLHLIGLMDNILHHTHYFIIA